MKLIEMGMKKIFHSNKTWIENKWLSFNKNK